MFLRFLIYSFVIINVLEIFTFDSYLLTEILIFFLLISISKGNICEILSSDSYFRKKVA